MSTGLGEPVRRPGDNELVGFVRPEGSGWQAVAVPGMPLRRFDSRSGAQRYLIDHGLAALAQRWWLPDGGRWRVAAVNEAAPGRATIRVGLDPASTDLRRLAGAQLDELVAGAEPPAEPTAQA